MRDLDLTPFETKLASRLGSYASVEPTPVNARMIAHAAMAAKRRVGISGAIASIRGPVRIVVVAALLGALLVTTWLVGARLRSPSLVVAPTPSGGLPALAAELRSDWLADVVGFGELGLPSARQRLVVADDGASIHLLTDSGVHLFGSRVTDAGSLEFRISTVDAGLGCVVSDAGTYRATMAVDGATVVVEAVADDCPNRAVLLARTWWRSFDRRSDGGRGLVAGFEPAFLLTLPEGRFVGRDYTDAAEVVDAGADIAFFAAKDPWGLSEPCSVSGGNPLPLSPGADPFVAYIRTLPGFTVSTTELVIDTHRAVHLSITTSAGIDCPGGVVIEWIAKADAPGGVTWHLGPGDPDSMYIVETTAATYLFQYLGPSVTTADEVNVLTTIHFVDSLATGP